MNSLERIETHLLDMQLPYEKIGDGVWVIHDEYEQIDNIVVSLVPPLVVFRVKLMELPEGDNTSLFRKLLELNATDMVHGAYGIENDAVVAIDTLQSENLDLNEFKASVDSLTMAIREHYPILSVFRTNKTD